MSLTRVEREQVQDSKLKLESIANSLKDFDPSKIEHFADIQDCLEDAHKTLDAALDQPEGTRKSN